MADFEEDHTLIKKENLELIRARVAYLEELVEYAYNFSDVRMSQRGGEFDRSDRRFIKESEK